MDDIYVDVREPRNTLNTRNSIQFIPVEPVRIDYETGMDAGRRYGDRVGMGRGMRCEHAEHFLVARIGQYFIRAIDV